MSKTHLCALSTPLQRGWSNAEAAQKQSVGGVEEENIFDLGVASPGGAEKSSSDPEAKKPDPEVKVIPIEEDVSVEKQFGADTVPCESAVLGAIPEAGVEAVLDCGTEAESEFLVEFVNQSKTAKRRATTANAGPSKKTRSGQSDAEAAPRHSFHHFAGRSDAEATLKHSFHHFAGWFYAEAAPKQSVGGVEEENISDLGVASPGGAEKSSSDPEAKKPDPEVEMISIEEDVSVQFGTDTVPCESAVLGAIPVAAVKDVLACDTEAETIFLAEFVKKFKTAKRPTTTTANAGPSKKTRSSTQNAGIYLRTNGSTVLEADPKPRACKKL